MRVMREDSSLEKRGNRNTGTGRRLGFLSVLELAAHSRIITKKYRIERAYHAHNRRRVSQLKMFRPLLKQLVGIGDPATDVLKFCTNIVAAHRTSAFGGKPALWDFMKDVATNLNRKKQGFRFSTNSKSFAQTVKIYGGRRMCDLFSLNFVGPTYMTVKRENQKGVQFVPGEHREVFRCVAEIYKCAMVVHGVVGPIPVILAEDETKVKPRITWEQKWDVLAGFCGPKDDHVCVSNYKVSIGDGEEGYNKIVDAFRNDKIGGFARVIMVSPMHEKLPRLVLSVACTCNCFDADWVKKQWERVDALWAAECEQVVGPILGHASDGDSRRHQLMLLDYLTTTQNRYTVPWEGWLMSAGLDNEGRIHGLHDQDFIHNGKKLINPLDSPVRILQLGGDMCCLEHIGLVYNKFNFDEHGLKLEDVKCQDRQNWGSAQRICQQKTRDCLKRLRMAPDVHQERTLGTEMYLQICADYIDIFLSEKLDLKRRVVLASKVSFFLDFGSCGCNMEILVCWVIASL
jgi:hypothetical protein